MINTALSNKQIGKSNSRPTYEANTLAASKGNTYRRVLYPGALTSVRHCAVHEAPALYRHQLLKACHEKTALACACRTVHANLSQTRDQTGHERGGAKKPATSVNEMDFSPTPVCALLSIIMARGHDFSSSFV